MIAGASLSLSFTLRGLRPFPFVRYEPGVSLRAGWEQLFPLTALLLLFFTKQCSGKPRTFLLFFCPLVGGGDVCVCLRGGLV